MKEALFPGRSLLLAVAFGLPIVVKPGASPDHPRPLATTLDRNQLTSAPHQAAQKPDREITAEIRRTIVKDTSLSTAAHNVKILVSHGSVTLRGEVRSEAEKTKIESVAKAVTGVTSVQNNLTIKPAKP